MSDKRRQFDDKGLYDDDKTRIFKPVNDTKKDFFSDDELVDIEGEKKYSHNADSYSKQDNESYNDGFDMDSQPDDDYFTESRNNTSHKATNSRNHNNTKGGKKVKKSNVPMIVSIIASVIAVILIVVLVIVFTKSCDNQKDNTDTSTTEATTTMNVVATETTEYVTYEENTSQETTEETTTEETTAEETTQQTTEFPNLIDANFLPYKCITPDGDRITSDFNTELGGEVSISLTRDGSYTLAAGSIANCSGSYTIDGNYLMLDSGYTGTVSFDDAGNPVAVIVSVDGYQIYFN